MALALKNSVFLHVQKTGGHWVNNCLAKCNLTKETTIDHSNRIPKECKNFFKFTFIRNPIDWYISRWRCPHHRRRCWSNGINPKSPKFNDKKSNFNLNPSHLDAQNVDEFNNFNVWLKRVLNCPKVQKNNIGMASLRMQEKINLSNFIGKKENVKNDLIKALTLAGEVFDEKIIKNNKPVHVSRILKPKISKENLHKILILDREILEKYKGERKWRSADVCFPSYL
jgi:hypothetical protein